MEERPSPPSPLELTEEQRERAEANRLRALSKRKAYLDQHQLQSSKPPNYDVPHFFKCRKLLPSRPFPPLSSDPVSNPSSPPFPDAVSVQNPDAPLPERFRLSFEICSPDSFCVCPEALDGFSYPGEEVCFSKLEQWLSNVLATHFTQNHGGGKASVYKLRDYEVVLKCLKNYKDIEIEEIPWTTFNVLAKFSHSYGSQRWIPCRPEHMPDERVEELICKLPKKLLDTLLPFQFDGLRFGLRRGGRCLIADEMGLGKTLQAIAIASCFADEGPILVVCPAILRYAWAEELEHWLPSCSPSDIHLVFGHMNNPANLTRFPKVVVISYTMLSRLQKSMLELEWAVLIVDESHHVRCTKKKVEVGEIKSVLDVSTKVKHVILLSGTPSLSRPFDIYHQINILWPGLLGMTKYEFAKTYCDMTKVEDFQGKTYQDFSRGRRLQELNVLLRQTVMIRRLKENLLVQLPPKRRQIIRLSLNKSDIKLAKDAVAKQDGLAGIGDGKDDRPSNISDKADDAGDHRSSKKLSPQELGIAKEFFCDKGIGFVRIDGRTLDVDRQSAVKAFQSSKEVKVAMIGIKVGYAGLDLSVARSVVFVELPKEPTSLLQAEDRSHRRGQTKAVNIYIFCAMETSDESHWQRLNKSLFRVSSTTNGKYDAIPELQVDSVSYLGKSENMDRSNCETPNSASGATMIEEKSPQSFMMEGEAKNDSDKAYEEIVHVTQKELDNKPDEPSAAVSSIQSDNLRFEVSPYTGRIHLWTCIPGVDSRPRPISENFRPEEIISESDSGKYASAFIKENPACRDALLVFIDEWNNLRRVDRRKLFGKPLQLPLSAELSYLCESANHDDKGLLKGGSRRRNTPLCEISLPLPPGAVWKQVSLVGNRKKDKVYMQAWSTTEEPLCKLCQNPCKIANATRPEFFEDLFCNLVCSEEYRSRSSNRFLRLELFKIERGVCTNCQLDCHKLVLHLRPLTLEKRLEYVKRVAPNLAKRKKLLDKLVAEPTEGNAWHADHFVPVFQGGGECRVENLRTLCFACHADVTSAQCAERKLARRQLKEAIAKLMGGSARKSKRACAKSKGQSSSSLIPATNLDEEDDDFLLVKVPGSAYTKDS